ncbi:MAG: asparaginase [Vampirovibrionales bacterium]|nr:asparaginase [Vampirovibrionales bacterium]
MPQLTLETTRGDWVENRHQGWFAVCASNGRVLAESDGAGAQRVFMRSAAKPFQYLAMAQLAERAGRPLDLSAEEIAVACGSHSGSPEHLAVVETILSRTDISHDALACGPDAPLDPQALRAFISSNAEKRPCYHNCSGKHAAMALTCVRCGWPLSGYHRPEHPLQRGILSILQTWAGPDAPIDTAPDGCGAPTFRLPLATGAKLFAWLGQETQAQAAREAMTAFPLLVSGAGRIDDALMRVSQGALVSKVGADGVMGVARVSADQGLLLKIADGSAQARDFATIHLLARLGWLTPEQVAHEAISPFATRARLNSRGEAIGEFHLRDEPAQRY